MSTHCPQQHRRDLSHFARGSGLALPFVVSLLLACDVPTEVSEEGATGEGRFFTARELSALRYAPAPGPRREALVAAQNAVRKTPEDVRALTHLAQLFLLRARETSLAIHVTYAEEIVERAGTLVEDDPQVLLLAAMIHQDRHRFAASAQAARRFIAQRQDDPSGYLVLGDALLELGDYDGALHAVQRALDLRPDLRSYNRAAHLRFIHGDVRGAIELLDMAMSAASPRDPEALAFCQVDLAKILLATGEPERALRATESAQHTLPGYAPALAVEARALYALGQPEKALDRIKAALERRTVAEDLLLLAELSEAEGDPERAARARARASALSAHERG